MQNSGPLYRLHDNFTSIHISEHCDVRSMLQAVAKPTSDGVTPKTLRDMSDSVLLLITTTVTHMETVSQPTCDTGACIKEVEFMWITVRLIYRIDRSPITQFYCLNKFSSCAKQIVFAT